MYLTFESLLAVVQNRRVMLIREIHIFRSRTTFGALASERGSNRPQIQRER
jgi:hypothetical protein